MPFVLLAVIGAIGYVLAAPKVGERFTEFYVLGTDGKATGYPSELEVGEKGIVTIGIVNHEYEAVSYRVEVRINGAKSSAIEPIVLQHEEVWEEQVSFVPEGAGENQEVEFLLYKNGDTEPYLKPLRLWLNVVE